MLLERGVMPGRRPIDAASVYAHRGWAVFPVHSRSPRSGICTCGLSDCGSPAKHPRVAGGFKSATTDLAQIETWWHRWPRANVGIRTGAESGLVVVDIDPGHGGEINLQQLIAEHGSLTPGRTVATGGGGRHLYFRHPGGVVPNDAGRRLGPGLDIRGDGGYVLAPPSRHISGRQYAVLARGAEIPALPDWLWARLEPQRPRPRAGARPVANFHRGGDTSKWALAAVAGELRRLQEAEPGQRNHTLNRVAFRLGQIIGGGELDEAQVEQMLVQGALSIGLGEREAVATVHSGLHAGESHPRRPTVAEPE